MTNIILPILPTSLLIAVLWGTVPIFHKYLLTKMPYEFVILAASAAYTVTAAIFASFHWKKISIALPNIKAYHILMLLFIGIVAGFSANVMYFILLHKNDSTIVTALTYTAPIFTVAMAYYFLSEKLSKKDMISIAIIVLGVIILSLPNREFMVSPYEE